MRWVLADGSLKIVSSNAEQEEAHEELEVKYNGDALDIGFNVNYLLDVLNNVAGEEIECAFGDSASSALIYLRVREGLQVRRHADEDLSGETNVENARATARAATTARTASRS